MGRAPCCEKVGLKKGRWTTEEDEKLAKYIMVNGEGSWRSLPKNAGLLRCGKSCRLRWMNYLRTDLKRGDISPEEEEIIIKLHYALGNRWSVIAACLPGRTDNEIKNYWNSHLSRRVHRFQKAGSDRDIVMVVPNVGGKRRGGKRSRLSAMKNKQRINELLAPTLDPFQPININVADGDKNNSEEREGGALEKSYCGPIENTNKLLDLDLEWIFDGTNHSNENLQVKHGMEGCEIQEMKSLATWLLSDIS